MADQHLAQLQTEEHTTVSPMHGQNKQRGTGISGSKPKQLRQKFFTFAIHGT